MKMQGKWMRVAMATAALLIPVTASHVAQAGIDSCGNIEVSAAADCKMEVSGGCTAKCTPVNFEVACSAQLYASCGGSCTASADVNCTAGCSGSCVAECNVDPGKYDCSAKCTTSCSSKCDTQCSTAGDKTKCVSACKSTCSGECSASCKVVQPTADCQAKCSASCGGSCKATANLSCQAQCQASGYAGCTSKLTGGCEAQCQKPEGSLFCSGQYVDSGGNLQKCLDALKNFSINIQVSGSASCSGGTCSAEASASCTTSAVGQDFAGGGLLGGAGLALGLAVIARRRRR